MQINSIQKFAVLGLIAATVALGSVAQAEDYTVQEKSVDKSTFNGWKLYKRQRCETCHGPTAEGGPAFPNLVAALKTRSKEEFTNIVLNGKGNMPAFQGNKAVVDGIDGLYGYLKGRSDGAIPAGELTEMQ
ncbi:MAG: c-type cytochrome [Methylococcaceae bacterium]